MSPRRAFTLIELLVVIAVIAVLTAILLPTLSASRETVRRVQCASNERQLYTNLAIYSNDFNDRLPYLTFPGLWGMGTRGYIYCEAAYSPVRMLLRDYCAVRLQMGATTTGFFLDDRSIVFCPSARRVQPESDDDWKHHSGYGFRAFGWYRADPRPGRKGPRYGATRMSIVSQRGPAGPKVMLMDNVMALPENSGRDGNNHRWQGGNVTAGDGSTRWFNMSDMRQDWPGLGNYMLPVGYYAPAVYQGNSGDVAGLEHLDGQLAVFYPDGSCLGWNHQPEWWPRNRALYGYDND